MPTDPQKEMAEKKRRDAAAIAKIKYNAPRLKKAEKEQPRSCWFIWWAQKTTDTINYENARDQYLYKAPSVPLAQLQSRDVAKLKLQEAMEGKKTRNAPLPGRQRPTMQQHVRKWEKQN